jgi:hypothetical protein
MPSKVQDIFLVGCSGEKAADRRAAKHLYASVRFCAARELAERLGDSWFVVSGKHGLLNPDAEIDPYDSPLTDLSMHQQRIWAEAVVDELRPKLSKSARVTVLASPEYTRVLKPPFHENKITVRMPFDEGANVVETVWLADALGTTPRSRDHARFYSLMRRLRDGRGGFCTLGECTGAGCPPRGVYFFFECEQSLLADHAENRVVRVGTHAVSAGSKASLWNRLRTHRGTGNGGGNHRSSIMRLHIGAAMLARDGRSNEIRSWGKGQSTSNDIAGLESTLEQAVSAFIGSMQITWIEIPDSSSPQSDRAYIEQNVIGLLSGKNGPIDVPDSTWLGTFSPTSAIRRSGLWNVDYVDGRYDPAFLDVFEAYVEAALGRISMPSTSIAPEWWHSHKFGNDAEGQLPLFKEK